MEDAKIGTGYWAFSWRDLDEIDECVQGSVEYYRGRTLLDIPFGELLGAPGIVVHGGPPQRPTRVDHIFGLTRSGRHAVLADAFFLSGKTSIPGGSCQRIEAGYLLLGRERFDPSGLVSKIELGLRGLNEWAASLFSAEATYEPNGMFRGLSVDLDRDKSNRILMNDAQLKIELIHTLSSSALTAAGMSVRHDCMLCISFNEPVSLNGAIETAGKLERFFSFCMEQFAEIMSLRIGFVDCDKLVDCYYPFPLPRHPNQEFDCREMPLNYSVVRDDINDSLKRWLDADSFLKSACDIVSSFDAGKWDLPINISFIAIAQALEALSKIDANSFSLEPEKYKRFKKIALDSIDDREVRDWIQRRLNGNNKGQQALLKEFFVRHRDVVDAVIPGGEKKFLYAQKSYRNSCVHPGRGHAGGSLPDEMEAFYWHMKCSRLICKLVIAKLIGLPFNEIINPNRCRAEWNNVIRRARAMYSSSSTGE